MTRFGRTAKFVSYVFKESAVRLLLFYWVSVTFQGQTVKLRGGSLLIYFHSKIPVELNSRPRLLPSYRRKWPKSYRFLGQFLRTSGGKMILRQYAPCMKDLPTFGSTIYQI